MADELKVGDVVFVTKYALTQGITTHRVTRVDDGGLIVAGSGHSGQFAHPHDYRTTPGAAIARAYEMKKKKIRSLCKQLDTLRAMGFTITDLEDA